MYTDYHLEMFLLNIPHDPHEIQRCVDPADLDISAIQGTERALGDVANADPGLNPKLCARTQAIIPPNPANKGDVQ